MRTATSIIHCHYPGCRWSLKHTAETTEEVIRILSVELTRHHAAQHVDRAPVVPTAPYISVEMHA